jgi:hypothetical protein
VLQSNLRRTVAVTVLLSVVSLAQPAIAMPRRGEERAVAASSHAVERWGLRAWGFFSGLLEKIGMSVNPDGQRVALDDHP